ncbi:MAG TPA: hypothetical protein VG755_38370 [Nannocystaceae bacterium]|nr:hypothetical protein [Nannocystaceae bacterium]
MIACVLTSLLAIGEAPIDEAPRIELQWSAPAQCPEQAEVAARAERLLLSSDEAVRAHAEIATAPDGSLVLDVTVIASDAEASYHHVGDDCEALADVAALFVAVAADPSAATEAIVVERSPPAVPVAPYTPAVAPAPRETSPPRDAVPPAGTVESPERIVVVDDGMAVFVRYADGRLSLRLYDSSGQLVTVESEHDFFAEIWGPKQVFDLAEDGDGHVSFLVSTSATSGDDGCDVRFASHH